MTHVLITGGLGFIPSHAVEHYLKTTDWDITVLDSLRHVGKAERLASIDGYDPSRVQVFWHDLRAPVHNLLKRNIGEVDYIINMAADSHVDRSIEAPVEFVHNNVMIALNAMEYAREVGVKKFVQVGTDEVYGPAPDGYFNVETDMLKPSNPYAASKGSQDLIAHSYWRTFGLPVICTRTMNNYGERQDPEKMIPRTIKHVLQGTPMTIHAQRHDDGEWEAGSRVWIHCRNHADAIKYLVETVEVPDWTEGELPIYNIGGENEINNFTLAQMIADILGKPLHYEFVDFHATRPGHDRRYALSSEKLYASGWTPPVQFEESLRRTISWYRQYPEWLE